MVLLNELSWARADVYEDAEPRRGDQGDKSVQNVCVWEGRCLVPCDGKFGFHMAGTTEREALGSFAAFVETRHTFYTTLSQLPLLNYHCARLATKCHTNTTPYPPHLTPQKPTNPPQFYHAAQGRQRSVRPRHRASFLLPSVHEDQAGGTCLPVNGAFDVTWLRLLTSLAF